MENNSFFPNTCYAFFSPNKIIIGAGASKNTGAEARELGATKALVVTDPGIVAMGLVEEIRESLLCEKIEVNIYDRVEIETPAKGMDDCGRIAREGGFNIIIGIGGGSLLDTAKGGFNRGDK
jgi:alcohol dehydrogenase class IV